jgi:hypothetical protein
MLGLNGPLWAFIPWRRRLQISPYPLSIHRTTKYHIPKYLYLRRHRYEKYYSLCFFSYFQIEFWAPLLYNVVDSLSVCTTVCLSICLSVCLPVCQSVLHRPLSCDRRYTNNPIGSKLLNYWKTLSCLLDPEGPKTLWISHNHTPILKKGALFLSDSS